MRRHRKQGVSIALPDALIGATALELGIPLYTCNIRHFPFNQLDVRRVEV